MTHAFWQDIHVSYHKLTKVKLYLNNIAFWIFILFNCEDFDSVWKEDIGEQEAKFGNLQNVLTRLLLLFSGVISDASKNMLSLLSQFPTQLVRDCLSTKLACSFLWAATLPLWMPVMPSQGF